MRLYLLLLLTIFVTFPAIVFGSTAGQQTSCADSLIKEVEEIDAKNLPPEIVSLWKKSAQLPEWMKKNIDARIRLKQLTADQMRDLARFIFKKSIWPGLGIAITSAGLQLSRELYDVQNFATLHQSNFFRSILYFYPIQIALNYLGPNLKEVRLQMTCALAAVCTITSETPILGTRTTYDWTDLSTGMLGIAFFYAYQKAMEQTYGVKYLLKDKKYTDSLYE